MLTVDELREWLNSERVEGCSHMIVVCDTFDYEDYPVYIQRGSDIQKEINQRNSQFSRVMEVYDLDKGIEKQLSEKRAWNI